MRYGSVCSGIEASTQAWEPLGWEAAWFAETDDFCDAVLRHHWPEVENLGDFTQIGADRGPVDLLVGGTPCQSFSDAGQRGGLSDPRGNLALHFVQLAARVRARWVVWENVRGVLSSGGGRDFGAIVGALAKLGYGWAYRVLDAQFYGVPQRRRRVFLVGYLGDWRPPASVLLEPQGLRGDPAPSRSAGEEIAGPVGAGSPGKGWSDDLDRSGAFVTGPEIARTITTRANRHDESTDTFIAYHGTQDPISGDVAPALGGNMEVHVAPIQDATASHDGQGGSGLGEDGDPSYTLNTRGDHGVIAFDTQQVTHPENRARAEPGLPASTVAARSRLHIATRTQIRRLTPREWERLQGMRDDFTLVPFRDRPASDARRYRAIGNSIAVPVLGWLGRRIADVDREVTKV